MRQGRDFQLQHAARLSDVRAVKEEGGVLRSLPCYSEITQWPGSVNPQPWSVSSGPTVSTGAVGVSGKGRGGGLGGYVGRNLQTLIDF